MILRGLFKPEYLYRPRQLLRRLASGGVPRHAEVDGLVTAPLPWGGELRVSPADDVGRQLLTLGVFDLVLTETLWRLTDPGELALDVGANVGYATAVQAQRVGRGGRVWSFEPHPVLFRELVANCGLIKPRLPHVTLRPIAAAVSSEPGELRLEIPPEFATNRGVARIGTATEADAAVGVHSVHVISVTLDSILEAEASVGVMKVDVEGHELQVIRGARSALGQKRIRDVVFEEHRPYPSEVTDALESYGYRVFRLHRTFRAAVLLPPDSPIERARWEATNFLATCDPARAAERFEQRGWACLRG
jgi:FkbM family methyltransferase